ncbi:helix-turn-helix domain-containing protein [Halosimplex pelagicum]|uniref:helix-turn-helix domain-containing protein n=1 Tax=Halosimplex pelagicum TaxID=869886 RepID=UPI001C54F332|nr:helix-turn-helix domain-containing protein [Halosimplex pelagicum]
MPRPQKYIVDLSADERAELEAMLAAGTYKTRVLTRARCLLHADDGLTDLLVSQTVGCHPGTVGRVRKRYAEDGLAAINRREADRVYERKLDGRAEAHLIALACSDPPEGRSRWSLHFLAEHLVVLNEIDVESISHETV